MADEITLQSGVQVVVSSINRVPNRSSNQTIDMTGSETALLSQLIGITSWAELTWGAVTSPAVLWVNNLDTTNFVQIANVTASPFAKIPAGLAMPILPVAGVTYYAKADTGDVRVEKIAA